MLLLLTSTTWRVSAQSPRDTINSSTRDSSYYYYDYPDSCQVKVNWGSAYSYVAQFFYSDSLLPIKGVAAAITQNPFSDYAPSELYGNKLGIIKHRPDGQWVELDFDTINLLDTSRSMYVDFSLSYNAASNSYRVVHYIPIYEVYFDKNVEVQDSFYAFAYGATCGRYEYNYGDINIALFAGMNVCKPFRFQPHSAGYDQTNQTWVFSNYLPVLFPIIDTAAPAPIPPCDTLVCPPPFDLRVERLADSLVELAWTGASLHGQWEVSYGPSGTLPDLGLHIPASTTTITLDSLSPGTHYTAYLRGLCSDCQLWSEWSDSISFYVEAGIPDDTIQDTTHTQSIGLVEQMCHLLPNPAHELVQIISSLGLRKVDIYDMQGRLEKSTPATGYTTTIDIHNLPKGAHLVTIFTPAGTITKRLIIE